MKNIIKRLAAEKEVPTLTNVLKEYVKNQNSQQLLNEYGCDLSLLNENIERFLRTNESSLKMTNSRNRDSIIVQAQAVSIAVESTERVKTIQESLLQKDNVKEVQDETHSFIYFLVALFECAIEEQKSGASESGYRLKLLADANFQYNKFLDDFDNGRFKVKEKDDIIDELCLNLNDLAKSGKIDAVIGRDDEVLRVVEVIGKRKKSNVALVGKAGVGKTAIAEGLALKIVEGDVPHTIKNGVVYSLQASDIVAGTQFRGQFEEKMKMLIETLQKRAEEGKETPILFIDEIHTIVGAGNSNGMDMANILKPALANGSIKVIGATTGEEWNKFINQEKALKRRFTQVEVVEPTRDQTVEILKAARHYFEKKHELKYTDDACERAVDLAIEFITDSALPDKAIDLFDLTGSMHRIKEVKKVSKTEIEVGLNRLKGIAFDAIRKAEKKHHKRLDQEVKKALFGQDKAIEETNSVLEYSLAGLQEDNKPLGAFLLVGPTGVGKTEMAKLFAKEMSYHFERIDMSEFMEAHSVSKLIGAPPGYVGYDAGGKLTKVIEKHPNTVLLLDEMEKAHPRVQDILLQVMDNARLTDSQGNEINFKNVLIFMTSNVGAREASAKRLGIVKETNTKISEDSINNFFSPEFRGRLNGIIQFNPLNKELMKPILLKQLKKLQEKVASKGVKITLTPNAENWLIDKGYNPALGARPLEDVVKKNIHRVIAQSILFGEVKEGKTNVSIDEKDGQLTFSYSKK